MAGLLLYTTGVDGTRTVFVTGELDMATVPELAAVLDDLGDANVTLDLWDVPFIDSSAISTFVVAHQRLAEAGRRLTLRGLRPGPAALQIAGLDEQLHVDGYVPD